MGLSADEENVLAKMRELGDGAVNDAHVPKTQTGGSGGGGRSPTPTRAIRGGPDEPTWAHRQAALRSDTSGERLEPHEIEFLEHFEAQGQVAKWIPSGHFRPTNDFVWVERDLQFELKTTRARYATIHGRIVDAASRAAKQGVTKENFVIDLGGESLSTELRSELADYNIGRRAYRLHELWVMANGRLIQIDLAAD